MTNKSQAFTRDELQSFKPKKLGNNTWGYMYAEKHYKIRLHKTDIFTITPDAKIILNSGGWQSKTTKERINTALDNKFFIRQRKYAWYVCHRASGQEIEFYDGMVLPDAFDKSENQTALIMGAA